MIEAKRIKNSNNKQWCYNNNNANCNTYGRLYDWNAALTACPSGWHLPNYTEWNNLKTYVGTNPGTKLKATSGWNNKDDGSPGNGADGYGFAALPGGYSGSTGGSFYFAGSYGSWWSASENYDTNGTAYTWSMSSSNEDVSTGYGNKSSLLSVRCVMD
jgi:uncharacterized protein (TIGR02145 family)